MTIELEKEILLSWERCIKRGIAVQLATPRNILPRETVLHNSDNPQLISIFERAIESISQFISTDYLLFLTGPDGILLSKTGTKKTIKIVTRNEIEIGTCFSEESCGTNAISLAVRKL